MMSDIPARTGRHRQLYGKDGFRLVAGCIPYRLIDLVDDHIGSVVDRLEVLMISSPNRHDLVFPKGGWEDDESVEDAALREALEEAGIRGTIYKEPLGEWEFRSKSKEKCCGLEGFCRGYMYAMKVTEVLESWPEQADRERKWLTIRNAYPLCRYPWMCEALKKFEIVMSRDDELQLEWGASSPSLSTLSSSVVASQPVSETPELPIIPPSCFSRPPEAKASTNPVNALC
ncbi:hypothetical protein AMTRI_Chr06g169830 [Amborella trichopoda]|uniref:nudix hydrolase 13, mitochondrial isoform X1 n=1 Tax=Amborella trichopoda TaxID=13333 RepID=UPI0005D2E84A|nr:nudix hydrolase 13, mitochondrial isoform X1 [Amborella trichopoda]XP_011623470.1 nudix hydrolase 13, mitochondrial isoform X1 [Amborella trichopoda]XP_011623471.1 nudix hydrolase 13, mitochondrial isoform X1 [Amborella trichopoda]XP_020522943.1 nudix hydrolase 13, mitochondrial isoform X1 [Amborella trichopoda]XP_020522944.1 nudix hydrolase 13, mitochondrial isoform X1 [Amborella trichopoda]|eukprot:XP_011623469.1 nudix hydrolase 13, mitochondrial isoform X1 [Amborella trichopoda]